MNSASIPNVPRVSPISLSTIWSQ